MIKTSEKMAILNMLEQGKITADSAAKLLAALNDDKGGSTSGAHSSSYTDEHGEGNNKNTASSYKTDKNWVEVGKKFSAVARELEPKIQKIAGTVVQKSVELADTAAKVIQTSVAAASEKPPSPAKAPEPARPAAHSSNAANFEVWVSPDSMNDISFEVPAGNVSVKGYNGEKVSVKASFKCSVPGKSIDFTNYGNAYRLNYDKDSFEYINIEAHAPYSLFERLRVETSNGTVDVDKFTTSEIVINTSKCHVTAKNINTETLTIDNTDGPVLLSSSSGSKLVIDNANAVVEMKNADFETAKVETTGETASVVSQGFNRYNRYNWLIRTSNAKIKVMFPVAVDIAYKIKAFTSLSDVSNGLPNMSLTKNERNNIEGKSANYDSAPKKVAIELETSNAPISIN